MVVPTTQATNVVIIEFLISNIMSRFGCPRKIVTGNAKAFTSTKVVKLCSDYNIILSHSATYYPQGNGLVESSNKSLVTIIKKLLEDNKKAWHSKLKFVFWADREVLRSPLGPLPSSLCMALMSFFQPL